MKSLVICVPARYVDEAKKIDSHITWIEQKDLFSYNSEDCMVLRINEQDTTINDSFQPKSIMSRFLASFIADEKNSFTEHVSLSENTNYDDDDIKYLLTSIIQTSEEAISVVNADGKGMLVNQAYTRLTGVKAEDMLGLPATVDISEGESVHMKVLKTKLPVRGVFLKVGPHNKDVIVNGIPIIVNGKVIGSVCFINDVTEIKQLTKELDRAREIIRNLEARYTFQDIIGDSKEIVEAMEGAKLAASTPVTVLLRGESGTGKELFAHAIHNASPFRLNKFVRVNCAALSESLLESELFGYEGGAFTGAKKGGQRGLFEEANNGSIFLDEIGELTPSIQAKLLRVLQENEIRRVGGTKNIPIKVRVIAATNVNLEKAVANGTFREDLYYRLNRLPIVIPPLRNRLGDIEALGNKIVEKISHDYGKRPVKLAKEAVAILQKYQWPGNVRELENILGRALIYLPYNENYIKGEHIQALPIANVENDAKKIIHNNELSSLSFEDKILYFEGELIEQELRKFYGNKTKTAKSLGISLRSLYYKMEKYERAKNVIQKNDYMK